MKKVSFLLSFLVVVVLVMFQPSYVSANDTEGPPIVMTTSDVAPILLADNSATSEVSTYVISESPGISLPQTDVTDPAETPGFFDFIKSNWLELLFGLLAFWEIIARLTPTTIDNSIISWITKIINLIFPNRKTGGGVIVPLVKSQQKK